MARKDQLQQQKFYIKCLNRKKMFQDEKGGCFCKEINSKFGTDSTKFFCNYKFNFTRKLTFTLYPTYSKPAMGQFCETLYQLIMMRHDTQLKDNQHNDIQNKGLFCDIWLSINDTQHKQNSA